MDQISSTLRNKLIIVRGINKYLTFQNRLIGTRQVQAKTNVECNSSSQIWIPKVQSLRETKHWDDLIRTKFQPFASLYQILSQQEQQQNSTTTTTTMTIAII